MGCPYIDGEYGVHQEFLLHRLSILKNSPCLGGAIAEGGLATEKVVLVLVWGRLVDSFSEPGFHLDMDMPEQSVPPAPGLMQ
jgi:hypothetical protein